MSAVPFGRTAKLITDKAVGEPFRLGLEALESGTGRLVADPVTEYEGDGVAFVKGDILFGKLRPYLAKAWLADRSGAAVGDFHVYRPDPSKVLSGYLRWVVLARSFLDPVESSVFGAKMPRASWDFIKRVDVFVPPLDQQKAIVNYLDHETAQIDELSTEQKRLIDLLRERRFALRAYVAQHGTAPVDEVASTLPWAERLPVNWPVVPLTSVAQLESGHTPSRSREDWWRDCCIPWVSLHDVGAMRSAKYIEHTAQQISDTGMANSSARLLPAGTVVLSRDATVGRAAIMGVPMATSQHFAAWVCGPRLDPEYLWVLFTDAMQPFFDSFQNGSTIRTIGMGDLKAFRIPVPPLDEQRRIVERLDEQTAKIDTLIAETEGLIALAKERRSALITAAVTGEIDVRSAAA